MERGETEWVGYADWNHANVGSIAIYNNSRDHYGTAKPSQPTVQRFRPHRSGIHARMLQVMVHKQQEAGSSGQDLYLYRQLTIAREI